MLRSPGMQTALTLLQQPMTFYTAMVLIVTTAMIVSPKWLDWWLKWKTATPAAPSSAEGASVSGRVQPPPRNRRLWKSSFFWFSLIDLFLGFGAFCLLFAVTAEGAPATVGNVAWCSLLAATFVVSSLRKY